MTHHKLDINDRWFARLVDGSKTAEVRKHDRDYQIGDEITFAATVYAEDDYRPRGLRMIDATVSHVLPASVFPEGIQPGYSVLSLIKVGNLREKTREELDAEASR